MRSTVRQASSGLVTGTVPAPGYRPGEAGLSPASSRSRTGRWSGLSAVRCKGASWHAELNPCHRQEEFRGGLLGHRTYLKAKAGGDNRMSEKRETWEGVDGAVLQDPCDRAKATLPDPSFPVVQPHTHRYHASERCRQEQVERRSQPGPAAGRTMGNEPLRGHEEDASVALDTCNADGTRERLPGATRKATECP